MNVDSDLAPQSVLPAIRRMWARSAEVLTALENSWKPGDGSPVFTVDGQYTSRGWTEWTQGFQFGSLLLQFDATGERSFFDLGLKRTIDFMAPHVSHIGVHDHGFNNVSTYGNIRRLMLEGRVDRDAHLLDFCELALKTSGAVQAARWSRTVDGHGYLYSFNGPHSLFCDTIRSLRALAMGHKLGHRLMGENDEPISLLRRLVLHGRATAIYSVFYGDGRDIYDVRGRVAHESLFNTNDGHYRCPSTQQGYSPFSTWTRGLAWIMLGYAEQLEFLETVNDVELEPLGGRSEIEDFFFRAGQAACDFYLENTALDGIPYWDTGAPGLAQLGDWRSRPAEPFNQHEPVDSSAAAIGCQGLIRLGNWMEARGDLSGRRYVQAGLTTLKTLLSESYLSSGAHQGLLVHSVYHRPRGWDYIPPGQSVPCGESSQWGDYHLREAALTVQRIAEGKAEYRFDGPVA
ncbi:glycoside hydrolase family 88 protein [Caulifigura coniformis]|nr:glycoside hydrolase family 88 protein [Caulifigura coniformis]